MKKRRLQGFIAFPQKVQCPPTAKIVKLTLESRVFEDVGQPTYLNDLVGKTRNAKVAYLKMCFTKCMILFFFLTLGVEALYGE